MKTTLCFTLTLPILLTLAFVPNSFAQVGSPEYVVRVIYFLPSDRAPQPDINEKLDKLIKDTQLFYAGHMEAHGFGRKTFAFEANTEGRVVVHRLNGQFNDAYYNNGAWWKVWTEIERQFDVSNSIYLTALDTSTELIDNFACGVGGGSSLAGRALIPASGGCFTVSVAAHELGHAFGMAHDWRTRGKWIPSAYIDINDRMMISFCSAEWLDVHRYFEINQTLSAVEGLDLSLTDLLPSSAASRTTHLCGVGALDDHESFNINQTAPGDTLPTVDMLGPPSLAAAPNAIRLRFSVTDADGIHQVQLHAPERGRSGAFIACKHINETSATVEFVTTELSPRIESVYLRTIDVNGNFVSSESYPIDVTRVVPPARAVSIPDTQLAAAIRQQIGNITTHSLLNLRNLNVSNFTGITNLTGIEYAYNLLEFIDFSRRENKITDVSPLENLTGMRDLRLGYNQIRDITPLTDLTNFETLVLWGNQISDITPLANLTNLMRLLLSNNQIRDITPLANLTNLRDLRLGYNQIRDITPLTDLTNFEMLVLWGNQISDITAVANLTNLRDLLLSNNQIRDITALENLTNLKDLRLGSNEIRDITPLTDLTNLTKLVLWYNQITDVGALVGLVNLEELYLEGNPIEDLSPLQTLLANNPNLQIDIEVPPPTGLTLRPTTIADQTFVVDRAIAPLVLPQATGGTAPYTYTLSPIPEGLVFNASTRTLSGTPTTPAPATDATYTATDAADASVTLTFTITIEVNLDVNSDGKVDVLDLVWVAVSYQMRGDGLPADVNVDGVVNVQDLVAVANAIDAEDVLPAKVAEEVALAAETAAALDGAAGAPMIGFNTPPQMASGITAYGNVANALSDAKHLATGDVRLGKWLPLLEKLLQVLAEMGAIPEITALLSNYPNPFNPETWIPYHLATEADVIVTIYDIRGVAVRELLLGHQPAGVYESRGRAAYWDGRNQIGEPVASGVYFYTLSTESTRDSVTAGNFNATRKMLIRK
ncbi:hypothetical protein C6499_10540 [Candidatus Poribacteria bacterium]|nr:MAG: hypothetical protein C6499_10540 [Candidatus Poribacteria bacterium]